MNLEQDENKYGRHQVIGASNFKGIYSPAE